MCGFFGSLPPSAAANDLALRSGRIRLAAVLLRLSGYRASLQQTEPSASIPANQREVASLANVSISRASDHLRAFCDAKMIRLEYGRIVILAFDKLEALIQPRSTIRAFDLFVSC
ncbi:MAG: helix-turn-helix domain-containing protein [Hyphomicrobiaceae bacterium]